MPISLPPDPDHMPPPHHHQGLMPDPVNVKQGLYSGNTSVVPIPVGQASSPLKKPRSV